MSFKQPTLTEVLSNEQQLNNNLISLRSNLRTKLTNLNVSYSDAESIKALISKIESNNHWQLNKNSTNNIFNEKIIIKNSRDSYISWNNDGSGYYLQSLSYMSGSNPALVLGLFNDNNINVNGSLNFNMRFFTSTLNFSNGGFAGVGITLGTPAANTSFNGIFFGAYQNASGEIYPATMKFKNTTEPTITISEYSKPLSNNQFQMYILNSYSNSYGNLACNWFDNIGNQIANQHINYTEFCQAFSDMDTTIRFGVCDGIESIGRMSYIPRLKIHRGSRIQL